MLPYNEIKNDIKAGCNYCEYEGKWHGYEYLIILDKYLDTVFVVFEEDEYQATYKFYLDEFVNEVMESYNNYVKEMNEVIYYNMLPKEE